MTPKQNSLYWREWGAVHKTDPSIDRHELHIRALGRDKSHFQFSNADLDKVLAEFRAITKPGSLDAQLRQLNQQKKRLIWKITIEQAQLLAVCLDPPAPALAPALAYILSIIRDQFPGADSRERSDALNSLPSQLSTLNPQQLERLRSTLAARINTLRNERGLTIHDMTTLAGFECNCAPCARRRRGSIPLAMAESNAPF